MLGDAARQAAQVYIGDSGALPRRCGKSSSSLLTCILAPHFGNSPRAASIRVSRLAWHIRGSLIGHIWGILTVRSGWCSHFAVLHLTTTRPILTGHRRRTLSHTEPLFSVLTLVLIGCVLCRPNVLRIFASFQCNSSIGPTALHSSS